MDLDSQQPVRLDKWLWAARFFKTRAQAMAAINGGGVYGHGLTGERSRTLGAAPQIVRPSGSMEFRASGCSS